MDRTPPAAKWQERLTALSLVAAVGLTTQFVVERTLPAPRAESLFAQVLPVGLTSAERAGSGSGLAFETGRAGGLLSGRDASASGEPSDEDAQAADLELASDPGAPERARRLRTPTRTRSRRFLPGQRPTLVTEPRGTIVAMGPPPAGWTDLAAPQCNGAERASEGAAVLVPVSSALVATLLNGGMESGELGLPLHFGKGLEPEVSEDGRTLVLRGRDGEPVAKLERPEARDARGQSLPPTRFEVRDGRGRVVLETRGALPPIEIRGGKPAPAERKLEPPPEKPIEKPSQGAADPSTAKPLER